MVTQAELRISHRALQGTNADDLYLIPVSHAERDGFQLDEHTKFIRTRGGIYDFGAWKREDGTPCEEEPGMIYVMGHTARTLCEAGECCHPKPKTPENA